MNRVWHVPQDTRMDMRMRGIGEYRVGSRWDSNSKLFFETDLEGNLVVRFNSNFHPSSREGERFEDAEKSGDEFEEAAKQYLGSQGHDSD